MKTIKPGREEPTILGPERVTLTKGRRRCPDRTRFRGPGLGKASYLDGKNPARSRGGRI